MLCKEAEKQLTKKSNTITFIDARLVPMNPCHKEKTEEMKMLSNKIKQSDNIIIGMGVHCYSINDTLKILLDSCFEEAVGKFYAVVCAAGGERSYLSTMQLSQICMNEWRMIQLPRIVYATGKDFNKNTITSADLLDRIELFSKEFHLIGNKLLD